MSDEHTPGGENTVPDKILDKVAYRNMLQLQKHAKLSQAHRMFVVGEEDPDLVVDLWWPPPTLRKRIAHLSVEMRDEIEQQARDVRSLRGRVMSLRNKAYGVNRRAYGRRDLILAPYRSQVIDWFGRMYTVQEIHAMCIKKLDMKVSVATLRHFRDKNWDSISELQEKHKRDYSTIRLVHKKSRLEELTELYQSRKERYLNSQSQTDYRLLLQTLDKIRVEVEGDKLIVDGQIGVNIDQTINVHLHQELLKDLPIIDIVMARVAAKTKINPIYLLTKLHESVYSKWNGFGIEQAEEGEDVEYVSTHSIDIEELKRRYADMQKREQLLLQPTKLNPIEVDTGKTAKEMLLAKLAANREQLRKRMDNDEKPD